MIESGPHRNSDEIMAVLQAQIIVLEPMQENFEFNWSQRVEITPEEAHFFAQTSLRIRINYNQYLSELSILTGHIENFGKIYEEQMRLNQILEQSRTGDNGLLVGYLFHRSDERFVDSVRARAAGDFIRADQLVRASETIRQISHLLP